MYTYTINLNNRAINVKARKEFAQRFAYTLEQLIKIHKYFRELNGVKGERESTSILFCPFGGNEGTMADPHAFEVERDAFFAMIPDLVTVDMIPDLMKKANDIFSRHVPVKDNRRTPEEDREMIEAGQRKMAEIEAKKFEWVDQFCQSRERAAIPNGKMGVFLSCHYNNSDSMTDYFDSNANWGEYMLLAIVEKQAQTERLCRSVIARYPELAALEWEWNKQDYSMGHGYWLESKGRIGVIEGKTTYGGHSNPPYWYEVSCGSTYSHGGYFYKNYPGAAPGSNGSNPATKPAHIEDPSGFTVEHERDWTWIHFSEKPAEGIRESMKKVFGARFSGKRLAWYITRHVERQDIEVVIGPELRVDAPHEEECDCDDCRQERSIAAMS